MNSDGNNIVLVISSAPNVGVAEEIARELVSEGLLACVQIMSKGKSFYVWEGELREDDEHLLLLKASPEKLDDLREKFMELHPYECPEWLELSAKASDDYAAWVNKLA